MPALELDAIEARVLGVLIEKETTTPDQYPLSLNALTTGCNQKSNRDPVLELSGSQVSAAIERLRRKSLVGASHGAGSRTEKYRHAAKEVWELTPVELAVVAELLLRGAQQPGELRGRADRMTRIESLDVLGNTLEDLRGKGFVRRLEPLPGTRAPRWEQIVAATSVHAEGSAGETRTPIAEGAMPRRGEAPGTVTPSTVTPSTVPPSTAAPEPPPRPAAAPRPVSSSSPSLEARVTMLELEVRRLKEQMASRAANPTSEEDAR